MCGGYDLFASSVVTNQCSSPARKFSASSTSNTFLTNMKGNYIQHEFDCNYINGNAMQLNDDNNNFINENGDLSNIKTNEPIYDDINQNYEVIENVRIPQRCSTIIEEIYGEV